MFQNIAEEVKQEDFEDVKEVNKKLKIKQLFSIQNIILYAVAFMLSTVGFSGELAPFGLAIFAATCSNKIPAGIVCVLAGIGTTIKFGLSGLLIYILTVLVFIALILIFRPKYEYKERNEKQKLGVYIFSATLIVNIVKMFFTMFLVYDLLTAIMLAITTYIFYKIFANSIVLIKEYKIKEAFSIEEVMGMALMLSIAFASIKGINIFGLSITNILSIMLVMFLGWKNGILVGGTSGITIGMVLGIITANSPILVAAYAISGMIAGIMNRLGKIGVIVGFVLGIAALTYFTNGNTLPIITIREILIASLALLFIPKNIELNIEDLIGKTKFLPVTENNRLNGETVEVANKLNTVSETILEMANSYNQVAATTIETDEEIELESRNVFKEDLQNNIEDFTENLLYDDLMDEEDFILDSLYDFLNKEEEISKEDLLKIFEKNNSYIIGIESEDEETRKRVNEDINQIVKAINYTYRINKLNMLWKQKEAMNKRALASQLDGVSKVISSIADEIDEPKKEVSDNEQYKVEIGYITKTKEKSEISGDSFQHKKLHDGKYMIAISDGMGSGEKANKSSKTVINMLSRLLTTGFDKETSIGLINSSVNLNSSSETYATLDISIIDLENGLVEFVKNGACPTFIKRGKQVEVVKSVSLPTGILENVDLVVYENKMYDEEFLIMCSDGILESNKEIANKELWIKELLEKLDENEAQKIAEILMQEAMDNNIGVANDDMTIVVAKLLKNRK